MALVCCPVCRQAVSDKMALCPGCGHPMLLSAAGSGGGNGFRLVRGTSPFAWAFLLLLLVGGYALLTARSVPGDNRLPLPVSVATRRTLPGRSMVLEVCNTSSGTLTILATLEHPASREQKTLQLDLAPGQTFGIGYPEGWALSSGDNISLRNASYRPWLGKAP